MTPPAALRAPLLFLALSLASVAQADAVLQQAEQLLNQRQPASAWVLLSPLEDERGGDPAYDYLLGRAALDTGRATEALFAFERCLAVNPKDGPCRVQMARAHMAAGEIRSARNELETVKASEPPAEVAQLVSQYLGALGVREMREQRRLDAWLQLGLGVDSNVNAATDRDQVAFPGFGGLVFDLSPSAQKQDSAFYNGEVGVSGEYAASPGFRWVGDARLSGRGYTDVGSFNNVVLDAGAGGAWRIGPHSTLLKLQAQHFELDSESFRDTLGLLGQYQYAVDDNTAFSVYGQHTAIDYHRPNTPNAGRSTLGAGFSEALTQHASAPAYYTGVYFGTERSEDKNRDDLEQDFFGLRAGGSLGLAPRLRLTGNASVERREFGGPMPLFAPLVRKDTQVDLSLGLAYQPAPKVTVKPVYTYSNSDSNIVLNDFDRHQFSLDVRFEL